MNKFTVPNVCASIEATRKLYQSNKKEPIPEYTSEEIQNVVDACNRIYQKIYDIDCYPSDQDKIKAIIINLNKGHYLYNGNKRISYAMVLLYGEIENLKLDFQSIRKVIDAVSSGNENIEQNILIRKV